MVKIKRVYEPRKRTDGRRVLVDRLWPRGLKKEDLEIDEWLKDISPSNALRKWFGHDPGKWVEFKKRFFSELRKKQSTVEQIANAARKGTITLLYGAKDERFNNAVALKEYIEISMRVSDEKNKTLPENGSSSKVPPES